MASLGLCDTVCPDSTFRNNFTRTCQSCLMNCALCDNATVCIQCKVGFNMDAR